MTRWIRKLHIWTGLAASTAIFLFGVAGLNATCHRAPGHEEAEPVVRLVDFEPGDVRDPVDLARRAHAALDIAMTRVPGEGALGRDAGGHLEFVLRSPNGSWTVSVLPAARQLRVAERRADFSTFLNRMHMRMLRVPDGVDLDWRILLWSLYVEFSIFALFWLMASGTVLWLATRPRHRLAWVSFATGAVASVALYLATV